MIRGLNDEVTAVKGVEKSGFPPLPKGNYVVKLKSVGDWKTKHFDRLEANVYDDKYQQVKDANGKPVTELLKDFDIYNTQLCFTVVSPEEYAGRLLFTNITTHPNMPWIVPNFLHAMGVPKLRLSALPTLVGGVCSVYVIVKVDKVPSKDEDGLDVETEYIKNEIKGFKAVEVTEDEAMDMDI